MINYEKHYSVITFFQRKDLYTIAVVSGLHGCSTSDINNEVTYKNWTDIKLMAKHEKK